MENTVVNWKNSLNFFGRHYSLLAVPNRLNGAPKGVWAGIALYVAVAASAAATDERRFFATPS